MVVLLMHGLLEIGIDVSKRVLFKIASTWEGIKAAEQLGKTFALTVFVPLTFSSPHTLNRERFRFATFLVTFLCVFFG